MDPETQTPEDDQATAADFEAGFNSEDTGSSGAARETPEPRQGADDSGTADAGTEERPRDEKGRFTKAEATPENAADEPTEATQEQGERRKKVEKPEPNSVEAIANRLRNVEGRFGAFNSEFRKLAQQLAKGVANQGGNAPTADEVRRAAGNSAKMAELKKEYPEFAAALDEQMGAVRAEIEASGKRAGEIQVDADWKELEGDKGFKAWLDNLSPEQQTQSTTANGRRALMREYDRHLVRLEFRQELIEERHEGWQDTIRTKEFRTWFDAQDAKTQALAGSDRASDAIRLLDAYAKSGEDAPTASSTRGVGHRESNARRLEDAIPATRPGSATRRQSTPNMQEDFEAGFNGN